MSDLEKLTPEAQEKLDGTPAHVVTPDGMIDIKFQLGPIKEHGVNGCQVDDVLTELLAAIHSGLTGVGLEDGEIAQGEYIILRSGFSISSALEVCLNRLRAFNNGPFACRENSLAITALERAQNHALAGVRYNLSLFERQQNDIIEALGWLKRRTLNRNLRNVEGTNQK